MKLANYLTIRLSAVFSLILLLWSVVYFILQMTEIYDGIDEGLNNLKQEFILQANQSPDFIYSMEKNDPINMHIEEIPYEEAVSFNETYITTKVYFPTELEDEEVRMLITAFKCELNGKYYQLKFFTSTVESEDLIKNMLYLLIALWVCLALALVFASRAIINKTNKPLFSLLSDLKRFQLDNTQMIELPVTSIREYKELNRSVNKMLEENIKAYTEQKNFIENASHELQTPVAIAINKLELLLYSQQLTDSQASEVNSILSGLIRMKKLNASLLLLSKIRNKQYPGIEQVDLSVVFLDVLDSLAGIIEHKEIKLEIMDNGSPTINMNPDLAHIMAINLVKNAIAHNNKGGSIGIKFESCSVTIANDGKRHEDDFNIFERYVSSLGNSESSGLGLSIVKSIAGLFNIDIGYRYDDKHIITLNWKKI